MNDTINSNSLRHSQKSCMEVTAGKGTEADAVDGYISPVEKGPAMELCHGHCKNGAVRW